MILLQLFICVIIVYNITQIISESQLFTLVRKIPYIGTKLFSCFLCTSVWSSLFVSYTLFDTCSMVFEAQYTIFFSTMLYSGLAYLIRIWEG